MLAAAQAEFQVDCEGSGELLCPGMEKSCAFQKRAVSEGWGQRNCEGGEKWWF